MLDSHHLQQSAAPLLDFGGLGAEHCPDGLVEHSLQTTLGQSRTLQILHWIYTQTEKIFKLHTWLLVNGRRWYNTVHCVKSEPNVTNQSQYNCPTVLSQHTLPVKSSTTPSFLPLFLLNSVQFDVSLYSEMNNRRWGKKIMYISHLWQI